MNVILLMLLYALNITLLLKKYIIIYIYDNPSTIGLVSKTYRVKFHNCLVQHSALIKTRYRKGVILLLLPFLFFYCMAREGFPIPPGERASENPSPPHFYVGCNPPSPEGSLGDSAYLGSDSPWSDSESEEETSLYYCIYSGVGKPQVPCILGTFGGISSSSSSSSSDGVQHVVVSQPQSISDTKPNCVEYTCLSAEKTACIGMTVGCTGGCCLDWCYSCNLGLKAGLCGACGIVGGSVGTSVCCATCCVTCYCWKKCHKQKRDECYSRISSCMSNILQRQTGSESKGSSPIEKSSSTVTQTPTGSGSGKDSPLVVVERVTSCLTSGYNHEGQKQSLFGMQHVLLDASRQVSTTIKMLGMKAYTNSFMQEEQNIVSVRPQHSSFKKSKKIISSTKSFIPYRLITSLDSHSSNMEYKVNSGQIGVLFDFCPEITAGLVYGRHKDRIQKSHEMHLGLKAGSVETRGEIDSLSAVVTLNPKKYGLTGHIVSYYGWGRITNTRSFAHTNSQFETKGKSETKSMAGLIQLGYNLQLSADLSCVPYIEYMISSIRWEPYQEHSGLLLSKFSSNNKQTEERSIGLHSHYRMNANSQLQGWISYVFGYYSLGELYSRLLLTPNIKYRVSIPAQEKRYSGSELGMLYELNVTHTFTAGIHGVIHLYHNTFSDMYMGLYIRHFY